MFSSRLASTCSFSPSSDMTSPVGSSRRRAVRMRSAISGLSGGTVQVAVRALLLLTGYVRLTCVAILGAQLFSQLLEVGHRPVAALRLVSL
jgi:hypothetical protein